MTIASSQPRRRGVSERAPVRRVGALDGLRGVAVIAVLVYHGGVSWLRGGYLGVDIFFVLSGYLITSLLLGEQDRAGRIDFAAFWSRRVRRLLPALCLVLVGVAIYGRVFADPAQAGQLRGDLLATVGYVANWRFIFGHQGYFDQFGAPSPLRHAWSLAVEEQFYLVWPIVVAGLVSLTSWGRDRLAAVFGIGALLSAIEMALLFHAGSDPSRVYYGTDTRAQGLLVGAALAAWLGARDRRPSQIARTLIVALGCVGAFTLCWLFVVARETSVLMYRGGHGVAAVAAAAVIGSAAVDRRSIVNRLLGRDSLRAIGRISYGLYLWHWPVDLVLDPSRTHLHPVMLLAVRLVATVVLALVSWVLVERPALTYRSTQSLRTIGVGVALAGVVAIIGVVALPYGAHAQSFVAPPDPAVGLQSGAHAVRAPASANGTKQPTSRPSTAFRAPNRLLLVGDSVAETLGWGLQNGAHLQGRSLWDRGQLGCGLAPRGALHNGAIWQPVPPECATWPTQWQSWVEQINPDVSIVIFDVWVVEDLQLGDRVLTAGSASSDRYLLALLDRGLTILRSHGGRVVLLTAPYNDRASSAIDPNVHWEEDETGRIDHWNSLLRAYATSHRGEVQLADLNAFLSPDHRYTNTLDGVRLRYDGVHFEAAAGTLIYHWLEPTLGGPT